ncbi:hypothetical protein M413DRAFT_420453, partial [Hebeloma cylindrosporum]
APPPTVYLDLATITGIESGNTTKFLGIPFGEAPRFRLPFPVPPYIASIDATTYGPSCPQQALSRGPTFPLGKPPADESEDCLSVNVLRPKGSESSGLSYINNFYSPGGFEVGSSELYDELNTRVVERSILLKPLVLVSFNYSLRIFGWQGSSASIGLYDQRLGLWWIHKYISAFGGDPSKVTIWGESAGAISVALHMVAFGGDSERLFRGAFMQSGGPLSLGNQSHGQASNFRNKYYDALVSDTGCSSAHDSLQCLRDLPFAALKAGVDKSPDLFSYAGYPPIWTPRVDDVFLQDNPQTLIKAGKAIPSSALILILTSDLSIPQQEEDFRTYIRQLYFQGASEAELEGVWTNYTSLPSEGSPFDTGTLNHQLYPQYKRVAAFAGDFRSHSPRRLFLEATSGKQKTWSYRHTIRKSTPILGALHGIDISVPFLDDYFVNFVTNLDPNIASEPVWPQYTAASPVLYKFTDTSAPVTTPDSYRIKATKYLTDLALKYPILELEMAGNDRFHDFVSARGYFTAITATFI